MDCYSIRLRRLLSYTPPVSTPGKPSPANYLGFDTKLKTPYSEVLDLSVTRELPGGFVFEAAYVGRLAHRLLQQRDLAMPLNLKDPKSGTDYFTAATALAKLANANTPVSQVPDIPYWQNLFPNAAGVVKLRPWNSRLRRRERGPRTRWCAGLAECP